MAKSTLQIIFKPLIIIVIFVIFIYAMRSCSSYINRNSEIQVTFWKSDYSTIDKIVIEPRWSKDNWDKTIKNPVVITNKKKIFEWGTAIDNAVVWEQLHSPYTDANRKRGPKSLTGVSEITLGDASMLLNISGLTQSRL